MRTQAAATAEKADRIALTQIAVHNADDGYSRRGSSLVHNMF